MIFFSNHVFETISDSDLTSDYKYFLGARLAKDNNIVKTCAFRMPGYRYYGYNVNATCYDINISQNKIQPFLNYDYNKIVPKTKVKNCKYLSMYVCVIMQVTLCMCIYLPFSMALAICSSLAKSDVTSFE